MKNAWNQLKKYPLSILFFAFLLVFTAADIIAPDREMSELENRPLTQKPPFNFETLIENKWTAEYTSYIKDQFVFRDGWISMQSGFELAQGKLESKGIWFGTDGYLIASNSWLSSEQQRLLPLNTAAVARFAQEFPADVHVMVIPSPANILSFRLRCSPPQMDENAMLDDMFGQLRAAGAGVVDLRDAFLARKEEPLYYRTDHHWTTDLGAWIAYEEFCASAGIEALAPPAALKREVPGFLGTNFARSKKLGTRPEAVVYYDFPNPMQIYKYNATGTAFDIVNAGLMQTDKFDTFDKYGAFLHGVTYGYEEIEGDGEGAILVVKDSYGNSFVPYLVQNYAKIGVVDLRSLVREDLPGIIEAGGFDTVLVLYSFNNFSSDRFLGNIVYGIPES